MKKFALSIIIFFAVTSLQAQKETNNWFFGFGAGLNYNSGIPVSQTGAIGTREGSSSISDANGNLLFYTDGSAVANKNHALMKNGRLLSVFSMGSSSQAALIVPQPGNDSMYYIFLTPQIEFTREQGFHYAIVNMKRDNNLGEVVAGPAILYSNHVHEKISAVKHNNGKDVWILTHVAGSNEFLEFLLTDTGLVRTPVIVPVGKSTDGYLDRMGYLKFSPDGARLAMACTNSVLELFDFNTNTGAITNPKAISRFQIQCTGFYGLEFSCDSKLLYTTHFYPCSSGSAMTYLLQYKVNLDSVTDIINSKFIVDSAMSDVANYGALQMAPDGRIIVAVDFQNYLGGIRNPNIYGPGCGFVRQYITLARSSSGLGLPNFVQSYFNMHPDFHTTSNCQSSTVPFTLTQVNIFDSVRWDFDDPGSGALNNSSIVNPVHQFSSNGIYDVKVVIYKACKKDTVRKLIVAGTSNNKLGADTGLCEGASYTLKNPIPGVNHAWQDGSVGDCFVVTQPGPYWIEYRINGCTSRDTINITYRKNPVVDLGRDTSICENTAIILDVSGIGDSYLWNDQSTDPRHTIDKAGTYSVQVTKRNCIGTGSIVINISSLPKPGLPSGLLNFCNGSNGELDAGNNGNITNYLWSTGETTRKIRINASATYTVTASNKCGSMEVTRIVEFVNCNINFPTAFTPNRDGINDDFGVINPHGIKLYDFKIYNRYGQVVFHTTDPYNRWDGNMNKLSQATSVFVWIAKGTDVSDNPFILKGTVTLIR